MKGGKVAYQKRLYDMAIAAFVDAKLLDRPIALSSNRATLQKKATKVRMHMYLSNATDTGFVTIARWKEPKAWQSINRFVTYDEAREMIETNKDKLRGHLG